MNRKKCNRSIVPTFCFKMRTGNVHLLSCTTPNQQTQHNITMWRRVLKDKCYTGRRGGGGNTSFFFGSAASCVQGAAWPLSQSISCSRLACSNRRSRRTGPKAGGRRRHRGIGRTHGTDSHPQRNVLGGYRGPLASVLYTARQNEQKNEMSVAH